jgi:hypothetical protein
MKDPVDPDEQGIEHGNSPAKLPFELRLKRAQLFKYRFSEFAYRVS